MAFLINILRLPSRSQSQQYLQILTVRMKTSSKQSKILAVRTQHSLSQSISSLKLCIYRKISTVVGPIALSRLSWISSIRSVLVLRKFMKLVKYSLMAKGFVLNPFCRLDWSRIFRIYPSTDLTTFDYLPNSSTISMQRSKNKNSQTSSLSSTVRSENELLCFLSELKRKVSSRYMIMAPQDQQSESECGDSQFSRYLLSILASLLLESAYCLFYYVYDRLGEAQPYYMDKPYDYTRIGEFLLVRKRRSYKCRGFCSAKGDRVRGLVSSSSYGRYGDYSIMALLRLDHYSFFKSGYFYICPFYSFFSFYLALCVPLWMYFSLRQRNISLLLSVNQSLSMLLATLKPFHSWLRVCCTSLI